MGKQRILLSGYGGQGVLLMGQMLAYAGMYENREVTFMPSYGPEMRGGTANCTVIISDRAIACPVADKVDALVAMNLPSIEKFEGMVEQGGKVFLNASLIHEAPTRGDVDCRMVDTMERAVKLGEPRAANMVMLGELIRATGVVEMSTIMTVMEKKVFTGAKANLLEVNKKALLGELE